jgi:hypothetical protein
MQTPCPAQWAAVTLVIVGSPEVVGAAAWLGVQRFMGNIVGGFLAYAGAVVGYGAQCCSCIGVRLKCK